MSACCDQATHERLKRESQFPRLTYVGTAPLGDVVLEYRNCTCGSTLVRAVAVAPKGGDS